jgi:hypothetical protein
MINELDPARLEEFRSRLLAHPQARIDRASLWMYFAAAFPGRPQGAEERRWLLAALEQLAAHRVVRLPSKRGHLWDHSMGVSIPVSAEVIREPTTPRPDTWRHFPWHPQLSWVLDLRVLSAEQERFLFNVHDGLVNRSFAKMAPFKYRSLQLTGDEKQLARLMTTQLFGSGRLDLNLLGCLDDMLPMSWHGISSKPIMLILENPGTFIVARRLLQSLTNPPYGMVGYGEGAALERSVPYLQTLERPINEIHYLGDLDRDGLRIVQAARKVAQEKGLPDLIPAPGLHVAMLNACELWGKPLGWPHESAVEGPLVQDEGLIEWLPEAARVQARKIIQAGHRIPEEILGPDELASPWVAAGFTPELPNDHRL